MSSAALLTDGKRAYAFYNLGSGGAHGDDKTGNDKAAYEAVQARAEEHSFGHRYERLEEQNGEFMHEKNRERDAADICKYTILRYSF